MSRPTILVICGVLVILSGCVSVDTPDVRVGVLAPLPRRSGDSPQPTTRYADALKRVIRQQDKVTKELDKGDWEELQDEAGDWVEYVRTLSGYADTSHDPEQFRSYCDQLLTATQSLRRSARTRDRVRCQRAINACDPILDQFARTFPLTSPPPNTPARKEADTGRIP